jgi:hypothetical protein
MNPAALVASVLALQPVPAAEELDRFYACDASAEAGGGTVSISSRLDLAGSFNGGEGVGTYRQEGKAAVTIKWISYVFDQNPHRTDVTIDVPLDRKLRSGQVMRLIKERTSPYAMALTAPAQRSASFAPGAHASADLETLLAYAGSQPQLGWIVETKRSEKVSGTGSTSRRCAPWLRLSPRYWPS